MITVLFRRGINQEHDEECAIARGYFHVVEQRVLCPKNSLIIGRFSTLPFYEELATDLKFGNSRLINSVEEHRWISNMEWLAPLADYTPTTWYDEDFYCAPEKAYVVKGRTNSRKFNWGTLMFAPDKKAALRIASDLMSDPLIGPQGVVYREYVPLVTYEVGINGLPFTNEWRFFYIGSKRLTYAPYWTTASNPGLAKMNDAGLAFADEVAAIASKHTEFFVLDIAEKASGGWLCIEVNDGQQSGLSMNDPHALYRGLEKELVKP